MSYKIGDTLLRVTNISKKYDKKTVIRDISFEIKNIIRPDMLQGQIVALIGRSGVGKSTLFRMIAGLEKPTSGKVEIFDDKVVRMNQKSNLTSESMLRPVVEGEMGVVFQNYIMFNDLTVRENFEVALKYRPDASKIDKKEFIEAYASEFNMADHLEKYPIQLSGGQRQRAAITVQLLNGSPFLLLDEPLSGLDIIMIDKITALLTKISQTDELQTIVIVSHDLENCLAICDTAFVIGLEEGKEGAILKSEISLMERGLSWRPDIKDMPEFRETLKEVKRLL